MMRAAAIGQAAIGETAIGQPGAAPLSIDEAKAWLRITTAAEDGLLAGLIRAAGAMCEAFTGQLLIERACRTTIVADGRWHRLGAAPVRDITGVATASGEAIAASGYAADIDAASDGWVRLTTAGTRGARAIVHYRAGLASDANGLPEGLRQGLMRMVAHLYAERDGDRGASPPAAVAVLWRPWRRMRL
jgi:uncharacterized phiE125 gp8 family phage protein